MMDEDIKPTSIRLSANIYNRVKKESEEQKRSITKQIEYIITNYYKMIDNLNNYK